MYVMTDEEMPDKSYPRIVAAPVRAAAFTALKSAFDTPLQRFPNATPTMARKMTALMMR